MEHVHGWTADGPGEATRGRTRRKRTGEIREKLRYIVHTVYSTRLYIETVCMYKPVLNLHRTILVDF